MNNLINSLSVTRDLLTAKIVEAYDNDALELQDTLCNARSAIDYIINDIAGSTYTATNN